METREQQRTISSFVENHLQYFVAILVNLMRILKTPFQVLISSGIFDFNIESNVLGNLTKGFAKGGKRCLNHTGSLF